jgi:hypothetical protein
VLQFMEQKIRPQQQKQCVRQWMPLNYYYINILQKDKRFWGMFVLFRVVII